MNPHAIRRLFPNASAATLAANAQDYGDNHTESEIPNAEPQRHQAPALGEAATRAAQGMERACVRFVGRRVKPLDPDNFAASVKDLLDGLRHAGVIAGDEPWRIKLECEQEKVAHYSEEETIIVVSSP